MQQWVDSPNLPTSSVTMVAVSEDAVEAIAALKQFGIRVLKITKSPKFAEPVASHADMQCHLVTGTTGFCTDDSLQKAFRNVGIHLCRTKVQNFSAYPEDCSLNAARVGSLVFANPKCICQELFEAIQRLYLTLIPVHQGYAKCSTVVVSERAIITADSGIAHAAGSAGLDILKLQPGYIRLDGYAYGFIGGTCGKLSASTIAFAGSVNSHPQAAEILKFLEEHQVQAISLHEGPLQDIGGILPLAETAETKCNGIRKNSDI